MTKLSELLKETKKNPEQPVEPVQPSIPAADAVNKADTSVLKKQAFKEIDPARCRPWIHHNRSKLWLTSQKTGSLIESIRKEGQQELGLVRPISDDSGCDYEIIYGVRRWYACSQIEGRKFKARLTNASDEECARLMHLENEESKDISAFEKACAYKDQIDSGIFPEKKDLSEALGVSRSLVTRMYKAASIMDYEPVASLFENFILEISIRSASELSEVLADPSKQTGVLKKAEVLKEEIESGSKNYSVGFLMRTLISGASEVQLKGLKKGYAKFGNRALLSAKCSQDGKVTITIDPKFKEINGENSAKTFKRICEEIAKDFL